MAIELIRTRDYEEMSRRAADIVASCLTVDPAATLGLATGSTPLGMYADLVADYEAGKISFAEATTFNLDEYRGLPNDHAESYHYYMTNNLFAKVDIDPARTHVPDGFNPDSKGVCKAYEEAIEASGGIDIQVLGIGNNGHIGFNEPGESFPVDTHCVQLTESTIRANSRLFDSIDEVPREAYTMGIGTIMAARMILLLANGAGKAQIVHDAFFGPVMPQVPASVLQLHPNVIVIVDEEAGALCE